jgi:hypothetical protein
MFGFLLFGARKLDEKLYLNVGEIDTWTRRKTLHAYYSENRFM